MAKQFALITLMITLMSMLVLSFNIQSVKAAAQVNILTHSGWLDSVGYYHVSGEVENTGDASASFIKITATFYDSSDTVIDTSFTFTSLDILLPGRKSPFEVLLIDTTQAAKVDHYSLSVTFSTTDPIPLGLDILSHSSYTDIIGYMHVVGEIKNVGTGSATNVQVIATFYDSGGNVVATGFTFSDPSDINAGQKAPFEIILTYTNRVALVDSYVLTAQSSQYALVPELSLVTATLLFISLASAMIIARQRILKI